MGGPVVEDKQVSVKACKQPGARPWQGSGLQDTFTLERGQAVHIGVSWRTTESAYGVDTTSASSAPAAPGRGAVRQLSTGPATMRPESVRASEAPLDGDAFGDGAGGGSLSRPCPGSSASSSCACTDRFCSGKLCVLLKDQVISSPRSHGIGPARPSTCHTTPHVRCTDHAWKAGFCLRRQLRQQECAMSLEACRKMLTSSNFSVPEGARLTTRSDASAVQSRPNHFMSSAALPALPG